MSCGLGRRCSSDLELLWLWCRPTAAAWIQSLAWEIPYAAGVTLKKKKKKDYSNSVKNTIGFLIEIAFDFVDTLGRMVISIILIISIC